MKLQIELTEKQLSILIDALESRFRWMLPCQSNLAIEGLLEDVFPKKDEMSEEEWDKAFDEWITKRIYAEKVARALQGILYDIGGFPSHENISDIWQVLRHTQYSLSDGVTELDVRSCEPRQFGDEPMMKVEVIEK